MAVYQFNNSPQVTLTAPIDNVQTTIPVSSFTGYASSGQFPILIDSEIMLVTSGSNTLTWTVTRAAEPMNGVQTASSHANGATVSQIITAGSITGALARIDTGNTFTGNQVINGTLSGLTGLTVASGGLTVASGGANITGNSVISGGTLSFSGAGAHFTGQVGFGVDPASSIVDVSGAYTSTGGVGAGIRLAPTITAAANSDDLSAIRIPGATFAKSTFTGLTAAGVEILGSLWSATGTGTIANAYGLYVTAPTIGTNNYAAVFTGGNVGIGLTAPALPLDVQGTATTVGNVARFKTTDTGNPNNAILIVANNSANVLLVNENGHIVSGGTTPTLGALQTNMASQSISGTDNRVSLSGTTGAGAAPAAGAPVFVVTFATTWSATPLPAAPANTVAATLQTYGGIVPTTTSATLYMGTNLWPTNYSITVGLVFLG